MMSLTVVKENVIKKDNLPSRVVISVGFSLPTTGPLIPRTLVITVNSYYRGVKDFFQFLSFHCD